jgi:thiol-disulfide isomerase/thioredoxin
MRQPVILGRRPGGAEGLPQMIEIREGDELPRGLFVPREGEDGEWRLDTRDREQLEKRIAEIRERQRGMMRDIEKRTQEMLREHGVENLGEGRYRIVIPDGEGRFEIEGLEGLEHLEGLKELRKLHDLEDLKDLGVDLRGLPGRSEFHFEATAPDGDWTDVLENLHMGADTGDGSGVNIVLPERIPGEQRDEIRARIKKKFGPKARIRFEGSMIKMSFSSGGPGAGFRMDEWGHEGFEPVEIEIKGMDGDDLEVIVPELRKKAAKEREMRAKKESSEHEGESRRSSRVSWHESLESALKHARESGKPVMVDFYADWCGPCKRLGKEVLSSGEYDDMLSHFEVVKVNVDRHRGLADKFEVQGIPDVRILSADGDQIDRIMGYGGAKAFLAELERALKKSGSKSLKKVSGEDRARAESERWARVAEEKRKAELEARIHEVQAEIRKLERELKKLREGGDSR